MPLKPNGKGRPSSRARAELCETLKLRLRSFGQMATPWASVPLPHKLNLLSPSMTENNSAHHADQAPIRRQRIRHIVALTLLAVLAVGAVSWRLLPSQDAQPVEPVIGTGAAITVTDATARWVEWPVQLGASGTISPWQEAVIGGQINGVRLTELHASPGDTVRRGQVLARYETEVLRADVAQLRAALRQAKAQAAQALSNGDRALQLKDGGGMSKQEVSQSVTNAESAAAQVESSQAQLTSRELQLRYATVRSPDDGVISSRSATVGSVGAVGEELFRLIRQNRLEWRGELTAAQLGQVARGQTVTLELPDGQVAEAKVRQLASSLDSQTRLGMAYADITPGGTARAGMYAQGRIVVRQRHALVVPAGSVVIRDGRSHVFKLDTQQDVPKAILQAVKIGRRQTHEVEVVHGLAEGDHVLVQGAGFLNNGDSVRVVQAPAVVIPATATAENASR